jgi:Ca2+-binding RTX toxin-like protein
MPIAARALRPWRTQALLLLAAVAVAAAALSLWLLRSPAPEPPFAGQGGEPRAERAYGELPLAFEPNAGRSGQGVDFVSHSGSGTVLLGRDEATLALGHGKHAEAISLQLAGAAPARPEALERLPGVVNDLRGDDPEAWRTEIATFERVRYPGVWPGTDLEYHGNQGHLEYDLRLAPGADPNQIAIRIAGADRLRLAPNGDLLITAGTETIRQRAPVAYQPGSQVGGSHATRTPVRATFALSGDTVRFRLGDYDQHRPLVIDPLVLSYSTYLGGNAVDFSYGIAVDDSGAAYVTGHTDSSDFDTVGKIEGDSTGTDAFVSKLSPDGSALEYSTYLGGNADDRAHGIAVGSSGAAYIAGDTSSSDFNTVGTIEGDSAGLDAFVSKLSPAGDELAYSTYLGGDGIDSAWGIAVDDSGAAYVTGDTESSDFNTVDEIEGDSADLDAFVSKLTPVGSALSYSTYLGGGGRESGYGIAVDSSGDAYVVGSTSSSDFDTVGPIEGNSAELDAFVSKLRFPQGCTITGTSGNDTLVGTAGADTICGFAGDDVIAGRRGDDELHGDEGNDVLIGSRGDDALDGGWGQDRADYSADATGGVDVNLATGLVTAPGLGTDTIGKHAGVSTVERARGSPFADTLVGDGQDNALDGGDGNDTIAAASGADILIGAGGADDLSGGRGDDRLGPGSGDDPTVSGGRNSDTLRYANVSGGGVTVDLAAGTASPLAGSDSGTDTLSADIENAVGSSAHDELSAQLAGTVSVLEGGDGADSLDTADGDALDTAKGGAGADTCATDGGDQRSSCP